jgi:hypothetical protein
VLRQRNEGRDHNVQKQPGRRDGFKSEVGASSSHNLLSHHRFRSRMALPCLTPAAISPDSARTRSTAVSLDRFGNPKNPMARNISTSTRVSLSQAPVCATTIWSQSMTKSTLLCLAAILSAAIATPALAAGETATRPWSAPVGHRQPRAAEIPPSVSPQTLDQEDIDVDRKIRGVCRGC